VKKITVEIMCYVKCLFNEPKKKTSEKKNLKSEKKKRERAKI